MPNGASGATNAGFIPNNGQVVQSGAKRILCVADVRGRDFPLPELDGELNAHLTR